MLILIVAEGPDKGRIYEWSDDQTVIVGRESKDLRLSDGKASRQHARFTCEGGKWSVRDLASRHGTFVNKIRTQDKQPLNDGDRIRIGQTELVVARVPVEQAERTALLGDQPIRNEVWHEMPAKLYQRFIPRPTTAAAMVAAGFAVGCSAWLYMNASEAYQQVHREVQASTKAQQALVKRSDEIFDQVVALGSSNTPMLNEILASVQSQSGNNELLGDIHEALAQMQKSSTASLDTILAGVESQSAQWQALAEVQHTMSRQQAQTAQLLPQLYAVAVSAQANEKSLASLQSQIEQLQARPDLDAKMLDQLEAVVAELKARPTLEEVAKEVRTALASEQKKTDKLLGRIETRLADSPDTQALVAPLRQTLDEQAKATEQLITKAFARQDHTDKQLDDLKALVQSQPSETATALRSVIGELDQQTDVNAVLAAVKQIQPGSDDPQTLKLLNDLALQLQSAPTSEQLADAVAQAVTKQLDGTRPLLEQIAGSLDAASDQTQAGQELIDQLRQALAAQEAADSRLDQIYDMLSTSGSAEDSDAMRQVLREIRSKSIAGMDELRSTIRREIQASLAEQRLATARVTGPGPIVDPAPAVAQSVESFALAAQAEQETSSVTEIRPATKDGLTDVEQAYRLAFMTGKTITLGGGSIHPETGEITQGRTLDPSAAKAAGITDWRDWYLMDDFAERMRLQQQAIKYHDHRRGDAGVVGIPAEAKPGS